jgi:SAM-dependent methyltransferase
MLMKAGVVPEKKKGTLAKPGRPTTVEVAAVPEAVEPVEAVEADATDAQSTSSTSSHEYIFHADWKNVLPYIDAESVQLILMDPVQSEEWMQECIRVLEPNGLLIVRGAVPSSTLVTTPISVGDETIHVLSKGSVAVPVCAETLTHFYESLISNTGPDAILLIPFANEMVCSLARKCRRSFIAMDSNAECVKRLYAILQ